MRWYTVTEAAAEIGRSRKLIQKLIRSGYLTPLRFGRAYRLSEADLQRLRSRCMTPGPKNGKRKLPFAR